MCHYANDAQVTNVPDSLYNLCNPDHLIRGHQFPNHWGSKNHQWMAPD